MYRKNEERCHNITSEFKNAFIVRNKCEQLKLEQQRKSLDRLRAHENLDLMNKRREILSLQMAIFATKPDENDQELNVNREFLQPEADVIGTRKMKFRSRALSVSSSTFNTILSSRDKNDRIRRPSLIPSAEKTNQFKKLSRSVSISGRLNCSMRRNGHDVTGSCNKNDSLSAGGDDRAPSGQAFWKLLPPIQLAPLHKQPSRSLKDLSSKTHLDVPTRKLPMSSSWSDLQDCRYLRPRRERNSFSFSE